jgi:hypothetical protein
VNIFKGCSKFAANPASHQYPPSAEPAGQQPLEIDLGQQRIRDTVVQTRSAVRRRVIAQNTGSGLYRCLYGTWMLVGMECSIDFVVTP